MQAVNRRELILNELEKNEKIDIEQLASKLDVSSMTIRRDLRLLEAKEKLIRTHGGAVLREPLVVESTFRDKESKNSFQKRLIAKKAVQFIEDDSTIMLDSGTTTLEIAKLLKDKQELTGITNDIKIAAELMDSKVKVIVAGGELQNNIGALFGPVTEMILKEIHVDLFFLGAHAIHLEAGITAPTYEKAAVKKRMMEAAEEIWLVADSSKFDHKSLIKVTDLQAIDGFITDEGIADFDYAQLHDDAEVIIAGGDAS